jgi:hypothetical protein
VPDEPDVHENHENTARKIVKRFGDLCYSISATVRGWNGSFEEGARCCADSICTARESGHQERPCVKVGTRVCERGMTLPDSLSLPVFKAISIQRTPASSECNWVLWGPEKCLHVLL